MDEDSFGFSSSPQANPNKDKPCVGLGGWRVRDEPFRIAHDFVEGDFSCGFVFVKSAVFFLVSS